MRILQEKGKKTREKTQNLSRRKKAKKKSAGKSRKEVKRNIYKRDKITDQKIRQEVENLTQLSK